MCVRGSGRLYDALVASRLHQPRLSGRPDRGVIPRKRGRCAVVRPLATLPRLLKHAAEVLVVLPLVRWCGAVEPFPDASCFGKPRGGGGPVPCC
jgi:hypothetical protein